MRWGVWDAPQGQPAGRVSLDQQLVEGLSPAEEEVSHRRTDQELKEGRGGSRERRKNQNHKYNWKGFALGNFRSKGSEHSHCLKGLEY